MIELREEPEENAEEQYCHLMLSELRKSYELAAKPYIDRLVKIKSLRMPVIRLSLDQAQELQIGDTQLYAERWAKDRNEQLEADRENLLQLLESASEVIGRFVSDEGWAQSDMDMMDTIDAEIVRMRRGY